MKRDSFEAYRANAPLIRQVWRRLERRMRAYPGPIAEFGRQFLESVGGDGERYFSSARATPLLHLPIWLGRGLPRTQLNQVLEATALLYFYVRIQDDVLDEPLTRGHPDWLLLGNCLIWDASQIFVGCSARAGYHRECRARFGEFSSATAAERAQLLMPRVAYSRARFVQHTRKAAVAELPLLAILALSDRWSERTHARSLIRMLGQAYALVNDVQGFEPDLAASHETFLIAELRATLPREQRRDVTSLRRALVESDILHNTLKNAMEWQRRALLPARKLDLSEFSAYTSERIAWLESWSRELLLARLAHVIDRTHSSPVSPKGSSWPQRRRRKQ